MRWQVGHRTHVGTSDTRITVVACPCVQCGHLRVRSERSSRDVFEVQRPCLMTHDCHGGAVPQTQLMFVVQAVTPLRYVDQRGEHAAHTHQGEHHDRYRSWGLVRCTCRKSPVLRHAPSHAVYDNPISQTYRVPECTATRRGGCSWCKPLRRWLC